MTRTIDDIQLDSAGRFGLVCVISGWLNYVCAGNQTSLPEYIDRSLFKGKLPGESDRLIRQVDGKESAIALIQLLLLEA